MTTFKCPHCNGFLTVTSTTGTAPFEEADSVLSRVQQWLDTPVTLSDLLIDYGCDGDLSRFEPLDRQVLRTAFRSVDAIRALGLGQPPESFHYTVKRLSGWSSSTTPRRVFGVSGRWWVKRGYGDTPGFIEVEDDLV